MREEVHLSAWDELTSAVKQIEIECHATEHRENAQFSPLLFRGHGDASWTLKSTLERSAPSVISLRDYYRAAGVAKTQLETYTGRRWEDLDVPAIEAALGVYDTLRNKIVPSYEYLVYLRHHGFPSPLLDWTASLYIAAFFAFRNAVGERVAIYAYQEFSGEGKLLSSDRSQILQMGPHVRSHTRHFLQQAEYTICARYLEQEWRLWDHEDAFTNSTVRQDRLWKITLPLSARADALRFLDSVNINAYSLFQSEDTLLETLAWKVKLRESGTEGPRTA